MNLSVKIGNLELKNPVMGASGTFGFGKEYEDFLDVNEIGAIVTKGVTPKPRAGNPGVRIAETPSGMLNCIGLENPGVDAFIYDILPKIKKYNTAVIGGDLTRSEKVFVSVCAIGKKTSKYDVSRKYAQPGDVIVVTGRHGDSAAGLRLLNRKKTEPVEFIEKHLLPVPQIEKGIELGHLAVRDFSMMDSSDGLADALYKIAKASNVAIEADFSKIPFNPLLQKIFPDDYKDLIFWGGEDFELVAAIPEDVYKKIDKHRFIEIGRAEEGHEVVVKGYDLTINDISFEEKSFKHFEEKK